MSIVVLEPAKLGDFIQSSPLIESLAEAGDGAGLELLFWEKSAWEAARVYFPETRATLLTRPLTVPPDLPPPELLVNLSLSQSVVAFGEALRPAQTLGPRAIAGGVSGVDVTGGGATGGGATGGGAVGGGATGGGAVGAGVEAPPAQKLALATMLLNRRLGRLNLVDVWRELLPQSRPSLARPRAMAGAVALEAAREKLSARQLPIVAFHLGAQNRSRRLSVEWFVALAAALASFRPFQICLLGVKSERALSLKFLSLHERAGAKAPVVNLCGETSVQDLAGLLPLASLLVSADTGVAHVGASLGIPQIVVAMGPAFAHETGPYNPRALVLQGLAPCGPCLENKGCERKQCRAAPPPSLALPLALRALGWESDRTLPPEAARDPLLIGGYFTTWETRVDSWGYRLLPTEPLAAPWSEESLTAMVLRETALRHFRESRGGEIAFRSPEDLLAEKRLYRASPARRSRRAGAAERRAPEDSIFKSLRFITQRGVESPRRARFMEIAREILASLL